MEKPGPPQKAPPPGAMTRKAAQVTAAGAGRTDAVQTETPSKAPPKGAASSSRTTPMGGDNKSPVKAPPPDLGLRPQGGPISSNVKPPPPLRKESKTESYSGTTADPGDPWLSDHSQSGGRLVAAASGGKGPPAKAAPKPAPLEKLDHAISRKKERSSSPVQNSKVRRQYQ